ncbi:MAG: transglutaminase-like cysteine peptidase [Beijerinckiaceae bacterium]
MRKAIVATVGIALFGIAPLAMGTAFAQSIPVSSNAETTTDTLPPIGWVQFCSEQPQDCNVASLPEKLAVIDDKKWRQLVRINREVNDAVEPVSDLEHWGTLEKWSYPTDAKGDCEDYVLEKRKRLIEAGWPRQSLLITVVRDRKGDGHAVLTVKTDRGDMILDNQETRIKPWIDTGYRFVKRQSESHPNKWVSLGTPGNGIITANR